MVLQHPHIRALYWKVFSCVCFASISGLARSLSRIEPRILPSIEIAFFQVSFGLLFLSMYWACQGHKFSSIRHNLPVIALSRGLCAAMGTALWFSCLYQFPLSQIATFKLLSPLLTVCGAHIFLKEAIRKTRLWTIVLTLFGTGCLLIHDLRASSQVIDENTWWIFLMPIGALLSFSLCHILGKKSLKGTDPEQETFSLLSISGVLLGVISINQWVTPALAHLPYIVGMGLLSAGAYYGLNQALGLADLTYLIPLSFIRFIASLVISILFFGESLTITAVIGVIIILVANNYLARKEAPAS